MKLAPILLALLLSASALSAEKLTWLDDLEAAKAQAAKEGKDVFVVIRGGNWDILSGWFCTKVLSDAAFVDYAKDFVLVKFEVQVPQAGANIPNNKKQVAIEQLLLSYQIKQLPAVILIDNKGRPYASLNYVRGTSEEFVKDMQQVKIAKLFRDVFKKASELSRTTKQKAHYLDQLIGLVSRLGVVGHYQEEMDQIIELDKDGQLGLRDRYRATRAMWKIHSFLSDGKPKLAIKEAEKYVQNFTDNAEDTQLAFYYMATAEAMLDDFEQAVKHLTIALQIDPESDQATEIRAALQIAKTQLKEQKKDEPDKKEKKDEQDSPVPAD